MYCRNCGKEMGDSRFCPYCGQDQEGESSSAAGPTTIEYGPRGSTFMGEPLTRDRSLKLSLLLCLLLAIIISPLLSIIALVILVVYFGAVRNESRDVMMGGIIGGIVGIVIGYIINVLVVAALWGTLV